MISIDWTLLLQAANFFLLLGLLQRLLFRPLGAVIDRREQEVEGSLGRVRELEEEIAGRQAVYAERLESVREEARRRRETVRQEVSAQQARLLAAAHEEVAAGQEKFKKSLAAEQTSAATALKREAESLAGAIVRKIAGRAL